MEEEDRSETSSDNADFMSVAGDDYDVDHEFNELSVYHRISHALLAAYHATQHWVWDDDGYRYWWRKPARGELNFDSEDLDSQDESRDACTQTGGSLRHIGIQVGPYEWNEGHYSYTCPACDSTVRLDRVVLDLRFKPTWASNKEVIRINIVTLVQTARINTVILVESIADVVRYVAERLTAWLRNYCCVRRRVRQWGRTTSRSVREQVRLRMD